MTLRSAAFLDSVLDAQHVETNPLYVPADGKTHCNLFARNVSVLMGAPIPLALANEQHAWLDAQQYRSDVVPPAGWQRSNAVDAQKAADRGELALASWANPVPGGHGHIVVLRPSRGEPGVWCCAAGAHNFNRTLLQHSFGPIAPDYFVHP